MKNGAHNNGLFDDDWFEDLENKRRIRPEKPAKLPVPRRRYWADPAGYLPDPGLADAMRVALMLRKPLLLTGEPGTGKTECAGYLSWKLGHNGPEDSQQPLKFGL